MCDTPRGALPPAWNTPRGSLCPTGLFWSDGERRSKRGNAAEAAAAPAVGGGGGVVGGVGGGEPVGVSSYRDDLDTFLSSESMAAARRAAGAVCEAVDVVASGSWRNAFCAVRPPGHHAGRSGIALKAPSQGFCLLNNVAIGARYAPSQAKSSQVKPSQVKSSQVKPSHDPPPLRAEVPTHLRYALMTTQFERVAIFDFDVHHGNGVKTRPHTPSPPPRV